MTKTTITTAQMHANFAESIFEAFSGEDDSYYIKELDCLKAIASENFAMIENELDGVPFSAVFGTEYNGIDKGIIEILNSKDEKIGEINPNDFDC